MRTLLAVLVLSPGLAFAAESIGGMVTMNQIHRAQLALARSEEPWASAWTVILTRCSGDLGETPSAVASYVVPTYADDPTGHDTAKELLRDDVNPAYACAVSSAIGHGLSAADRATYSQKAQDLLNNWASTNTSVSGSGSEVEEGQLVFAYVASAFMATAELLSLDSSWTSGERTTFTAWVNTVHDQVYNDIQDRTNNWGSWASLLGIAGSQWKGDTSERATRITRLKAQIDSQINSASQSPEGGLPLELARDDGDGPCWYTYYSLAPLTHAAYVVRNATGADLFSYEPPTGGTLLQAMTLFYDIVLDPSGPDADCDSFTLPSATTWAGQLLFAGGTIYRNQTWIDYANHPLGTSNSAWKAVDVLVPDAPGPGTCP